MDRAGRGPLDQCKADATLDPIWEEVRDAALEYARLGYHVVRVAGLKYSGSRLICTCRKGPRCESPGKHPNLGRAWPERAAMTTVGLVETWWDERPRSNVGLAAGSGLVVIDLDLPEGMRNWESIQAEFEEAPATWTVTTGSGGRHLYFTLPRGRETGNSLPALRGVKNIDVRGTHGQVVAPPSLHYSGRRYSVEVDVPPAELPSWLFTPRPSKRSPRCRSPRPKPDPSLAPPKPETPATAAFIKEWWESIDTEAVLPEKVERWIRTGRQGDQSVLVYDICLSVVQRHYNPAKLYLRFSDEANRGGLGVQRRENQRGDDEVIDQWMRSTLDNALRYIASFVVAIRRVRAEVDQFLWPDMPVADADGCLHVVRGKNVRAVLLAVLSLAEQYTNTTIVVSKSKVREVTGLDRRTIAWGLRALESLGWLEVEVQATTAAGWFTVTTSGRLNPPVEASSGS